MSEWRDRKWKELFGPALPEDVFDGRPRCSGDYGDDPLLEMLIEVHGNQPRYDLPRELTKDSA